MNKITPDRPTDLSTNESPEELLNIDSESDAHI